MTPSQAAMFIALLIDHPRIEAVARTLMAAKDGPTNYADLLRQVADVVVYDPYHPNYAPKPSSVAPINPPE